MIPLNHNLGTLKRSQIRVFTNLARETPGCAMLTIGEPDFDTPEAIKAAAMAAIADNHTHYAPNQGTPALRQAVPFCVTLGQAQIKLQKESQERLRSWESDIWSLPIIRFSS